MFLSAGGMPDQHQKQQLQACNQCMTVGWLHLMAQHEVQQQ
jgi:hypothetical protein